MDKNIRKQNSRIRRKNRGRKRVQGSSDRPRLCIYRSNAHWYAQIIDDRTARVLVSASTRQAEVKKDLKSCNNLEAARKVGGAIGVRAIEASILQVVFDKNGFHYHGRVKGLADAAREAGLKF